MNSNLFKKGQLTLYDFTVFLEIETRTHFVLYLF